MKGFADKYRGLFDGEAFSWALAVPGPQGEDFLRASFDAKTRSGTSAAPPAGQCSSSVFRATAERAVPLFKAGATLCLSQVETRVPKLAPFLAVVKRQLGYPGKASFSAYLSPPGSGFNRHFDGRIASTLQIEGTKTWRFSNLMAIAWPRGNGTLGADGAARYADPGVTAQEWERPAARAIPRRCAARPSLNDRLGPSCGERPARQDLEGAGPGRRVQDAAKRSRAWLRQPLPASDPSTAGEAQDWRRSALLFRASRRRPRPTILGIDRSRAMMRSLWISKTGMEAQQMQLDNISNNLANVSTNGYKSSHAVFEDLIYQNLRQAGASSSDQTTLPTGLQVGLGTRAVATSRNFSQGNLQQTSNTLDLAIQGKGFFQVQLPDGTTGYTRDGSFQVSAQGQLVTNSGYTVQPGITIPTAAQSVTIGNDGTVTVTLPGQAAAQTVGHLQIAGFINPAGLEPKGGNLYAETTASGSPTPGTAGTNGLGTLQQGFVETSNVNVVEELVQMIQTQRSYELNSKSIQTADQMLEKLSSL